MQSFKQYSSQLIMTFAFLAALLFAGHAIGEERVTLPPSPFDEVNRNFDDFVQTAKALAPEVDKLITVHLSAKPALLMKGEKITIKMTAYAKSTPNPTLEIYPRSLEDSMRNREVLQLPWKKAGQRGDKTTYQATLVYKPKVTGNYALCWKNDIGGDIPEFWRSFAVIDNSYAVCGVECTNGGEHGPEPILHRYHLPLKSWVQPTLARAGWNAEMWAAFSRSFRQHGDTPSFLIWCSNGEYMKHNPACKPDVSGWQVIFQKETPEVQRLVLERYKQDVWPLLGFDDPIENVHTYGIGNTSLPMARELGYKTIGSLCASQNWRDDTFLINHSGMPDRPFFISKEDFRKSGDGGKNGVVGVQQCHRHPSLTSDYNCVYSLEPCCPFHPCFGGVGRKAFDEISYSNTLDFFEAMLQNRLSQKTPYFFNLGLEMGGAYPGAEESNEFFIHYMVKKAGQVPLVFASGDAISEFYRSHFSKTPETTCYLPDFYCGSTSNGKPAVYPDIIEIESDKLKALLREPEILPYNQYDYEQDWTGYPDWGNDDIPRKEHGYIYPDTDDRFRMTPRMIDTRAFQVSRADRELANATEIIFTVQSKVRQNNLTLAVWDIPRAWQTGAKWYDTSRGCRFVPVREPFSGTLNGLLIANVKAGENKFTLRLTSPAQKPQTTGVSLNGGHIQGRVFARDGKQMAYLAVTGSAPQTLRLNVPEGKDVRVYIAPEGAEVRCKAGRNEFKLAPAAYLRMTGLSRDEVATLAQGEGN